MVSKLILSLVLDLLTKVALTIALGTLKEKPMRKYLDNIDWRRIGKIVLVAIPVLIWDVTYFFITKLYEFSTVIDKKGEKFLDSFM